VIGGGMRYLFQRVVHNENRWTRPSPGRLRSKTDGGYVQNTGFAHEDWNFRKDICDDGYVHGYMYFPPKDPDGLFNILFATYDPGEGWALAGFYDRASFNSSGTRFPPTVLRRRARELKELDSVNSLGRRYSGLSLAAITDRLRLDAIDYRWRVRAANLHPMQVSLRLRSRLVDPRWGKYFTRPTEISKDRYDAIVSYAKKYADRVPEEDYAGGGETEFPEGRKYQVMHFARERNQKLVGKAKARFRTRHGRLFCEACKFDFEEVYGSVGTDFIEVHHKKPVSELKPGARTTLDELALVCSNCHRMLHRRRPWMTIAALRKMLKEAS
jgi:HNH endonuclease